MKKIVCLLLAIVICLTMNSVFAATMGEQNALRSAQNYLSFMCFSYKGLCEQLEYEGYSHSESVYAADNCGADWYDQAAGSAKNYLSFMSFSRQGLVEQLEYEGFSKAEAEYGAAVAYGENPSKPGNQKKKEQTSSSSNLPTSENDFLSLAEGLVKQVVDFSGKNTAVLSASGYDPSYCILLFNFNEGDQSISAIDGDKCEIFYFIDDDEMMSALFQMIIKFNEIESNLSSGKKLQYKLRFSDNEIQIITSETMSKYYSWVFSK